MPSRPRHFRPTTLDDFSKTSYRGLSISSYKQTAFPLGCSSSEFELSLDEREVTLFQEKSRPVAFFRIKNATETHLFFDLFCIGGVTDCIEPLDELMLYLLTSYRVNKFFIQLFEHETMEQSLMTHHGFQEEARLTNQVWLQGRYQDVIIMGSPLHV